jgi:hypothetical protein
MIYKGSCHCGRISFEVEGQLEQVAQCNCSICSKRGSLIWPVSPQSFRLLTPIEDLSTYTFGKHKIKHRFCQICGCAPYGEGEVPGGRLAGRVMVGINARCLDNVDLSTVKVVQVDGRSF